MRDASDDYETLVIIDGIDDPVVADSDPVVVAPGELRGSWGSGVFREAVNRGVNAIADRLVQTSIRSSRLRVQPDLVLALRRCAYVRTSDQGRAASRSSRAWRAERLSSR